MKKMIVIMFISMWFVGFQSGRTDFSGKWKLDIKKSSHLPGSFKSVESYVMDVRQTSDSMLITVNMAGAGQHVTFPLTAYSFDGNEVFREDTARGSKRWSKSIWMTTGKKLIIESRANLKKGNQVQEFTQRDVWQLNNSNTIQISVTQHFTQGDSTHSERRLFHRTK